MAVSCQVARFQKNSSGTDGVTQDVSLNFTPKAVIVYSDGSVNNNTIAAHYQFCLGFSDGTNHACIAATSDDSDGTSDTSTVYRNDSVFVRLEETSNETQGSYGSCAFITNGVRFTWTENGDRDATYINLIAFGGDDITNAKVNTVTVAKSGTGTQDYTGLGFNPTGGANSILFTLNGFITTLNAASAGLDVSFGSAVSSTKRYTSGSVAENAQDPMDCWAYFSNSTVLNIMDATTGIIDGLADFSAWITDGFRLNWTDAVSNTGFYFSYLVINGGTWDIGSLISPNNVEGYYDYSVSVNSNTLRGVILGGSKCESLDTVESGTHADFGSSDGTNQSAVASIDSDGYSTDLSRRVNSGVDIARTFTWAGADYETAVFDSFTTNNFRLNWTLAGSQLIYHGWVVVADGAAGPQLKYGTINESPSVSVSETLARVQTLIKPISDTPTISISENLVRGLSYPRPIINEPQVSVSAGTLERIQYLIKLITNESQVTIPTETLAKVAAHPRPISDTPTVTVSETLEKILTDIRSITNESSVSVDESLAKYSIFPRSISDTPTISVSESLARIQSIIKLITNEPEVSISALATGNFLISKIINESPSISVSETLERIQYIIKSISDTPEVTISELLAGTVPVIQRPITEPSIDITPTTVERIAIFPRSISDTPIISISEALARVQIFIRNITNEPEITTSDVASTLALIIRTLTEPSTNISEEITRIQTLIKLISDPEISVNDTVTGLRALLISILESRIKWYYSLLTRKIPEGEV